jgi:hypothetical protein
VVKNAAKIDYSVDSADFFGKNCRGLGHIFEQKGELVMKKKHRFPTMFACLLAIVSISLVARAQQPDANEILEATGVKGGLIAHIGLGKTHFRLFAANRNPLSIEKPADKKKRRRAPAKSTLRAPKRQRSRLGNPVKYHWSQQVPLVVRAMVLAEATLFLAGTPVSAKPSLDGPDFGSDRADALAAFEADSPGEKESVWGSQANKSAVLYVVSTADGKKIAEYKLDSPSVFDDMAATNGRLYLVTKDGSVLCLRANE